MSKHKLRKLGDVEWHALSGDLEGVSVGIAHVGPGKAKMWSMAAQAIRVDEMRRITELRKEISKEVLPALYAVDDDGAATYNTPEGIEAHMELARQIAQDCVVGVKGAEAVAEWRDAEAAVEWVNAMGVADVLMGPAMQQQSLRAQEVLSEGPRSVATGADATGGGGPVPRAADRADAA